ncbi:Uncharacterised protein [Mycobacteroides abscessus subsp. abscessus]|nr:Uncharacterised protein [Mycobacteroides abscessus subsp. abscessus]
MSHQVASKDIGRADAKLLGDVLLEPEFTAPHRVHMPLRVDHPFLAFLGTDHVNRHVRHPQNRLIDPNQCGAHRISVAYQHAPRQSQIAVQPGLHPGAPVGLQGDHRPPRLHAISVGLHPQVRAVGMCSDHPEGSVFSFHVNAAPGHDRARPHHEVVPRVARPALRLE